MAPDRVNDGNVLYVVQDHERRLQSIEGRTEDLGVMRRDIETISAQCGELREELESLRKVIVTASVSIAGSSLFAAATIFLVLK